MSCHPPHADAGDDAFSHRRDSKSRIVARDAQVAGEGNLEAAADAVRLDRRDDDLIQGFELAQRSFPVPKERHAGLALRQRRQIDSATEGAAGTAQDDDSKLLIGRQIVDERVQIACPLLIGAVQHLRTIEHQCCDSILHGGIHGFELHPASFARDVY
jgi:hypothetical protein